MKKQNKEKNKKKENIEDYQLARMKKIVKVVAIIAAIIVSVEGILLAWMKYQEYQNSIYYDAYSMVDIHDDTRVVVGSSDFKNSKFASYTNGLEKGKIAKYDKDGKLLWEKAYDDGNNSTFSAIKVVSDGYIVVGSSEFNEYQIENSIREGIVVKYDFEGNKVWQKRYALSSNTKFLDLLVIDDGFVVVGQSIYENLELGNKPGGGVIVKYDFDGNMIWEQNYGGNKSGIFHAISKLEDGFVAVGRDSKDTGITVVYDKDGNRKWVKNYSYTDSDGFKDVVTSNDKIYVVGSKKIWTDTGNEEEDNMRNAKNTDAIVAIYDTTGKLLDEKTFGGSAYERYESVTLVNDALYLVGHMTSTDTDLKIESHDSSMTGLLVKMDLEGNILSKNTYGGKNDDNLLYLVPEENHFIAVGLSNSKDGSLKGKGQNGKDYYGQVITFDENLVVTK